MKGARKHGREVKEERFYNKEIPKGSFVRSFALPGDVKAEIISAEFKDGVLTIEMPRPESRKLKQMPVN
jgi:HSP20 family protein